MHRAASAPMTGPPFSSTWGGRVVTACHVIDGWMASRSSEDAGPLRLGGDGQSVAIDLDRDAIAMDREIDIATFRVGERDVKALGKKVLTGHQKAWPPAPPEERCGIYYAGYPGIGTRHPSPREGGLMLTVIQNRLRELFRLAADQGYWNGGKGSTTFD